MDTVVVIMLKDNKTGFLDKEIASLSITENEEFIVNIFAAENEAGNIQLHFKLTTDRDLEDWEFSAVFDYYDIEVFNGIVNSVSEIDDDYNPTWEIVLDYVDDKETMENKIIEILRLHKNELMEVYNNIKDKESEYTENE